VISWEQMHINLIFSPIIEFSNLSYLGSLFFVRNPHSPKCGAFLPIFVTQ
jgi:hypothetical protein